MFRNYFKTAWHSATPLAEETNVVVSEDIARKYFNSTDVIGKTMEINEDGKLQLK